MPNAAPPMFRFVVMSTVMVLVAATAHGEWDWLPPSVEEGLARQLALGFVKANVATNATEEERLDAARQGVGLIAERLEEFGLETVLASVPSFEGLELPKTGSEIVDAIAAFGTCSLPLHFELAADDAERLYVAIGEVAVIVQSAFLRHAYLARGGSDGDLARFLNTEEFALFSLRVQQDPDLRAAVSMACAEPLGALMP